MRKMGGTLVYWFTGVFICLSLAANAFPKEVPSSANRTGFHVKQRPDAIFDHDDHNETAAIEDCDVCHHRYQNGVLIEGESSEGQPCSDCHPMDSHGPTRNLVRAYHRLCKGCHIAKEAGPIVCGQCHVRR